MNNSGHDEKRTTITVSLPRDLKARLVRFARAMDMTVSQLVRRLIRAAVPQDEPRDEGGDDG